VKIELTHDQLADAIKMANVPDLPNFSKAGTGKTHTALKALEVFRPTQSLILCPLIAVDWWAEQARDFIGMDARVLTSGDSKFGGDVMITTYDVARNMASRLFEHYKSGALIMDESHYVRNPDANRTKAIFGQRADGYGGLVSRFDTAWCMSGTPIEGYANDMWTQAGVLHPAVWDKYDVRTYGEFCDRFTFRRKKQFNPRMQPVWKISGNTNEGLLHRIVYQEIGAIRRQEAPGLPALRMRRLHVPIKLTAEVRRAMAGLTSAEIVERINSDEEVMAKIWKVIGLAKVPEIVPYCGDLMRDGPLLLGCWHRDVMTEYEQAFKAMGKRVIQVNGDTPASQISQIRNDFNAGNIDCIIGQMRKMGVSWNLQEACSNVVIAEIHPSPSMLEQFYKRVYRFGQKRPVQVDIILSTTNVDEALDGVQMRKATSDAKINQ
jgi:hypothetical protein